MTESSHAHLGIRLPDTGSGSRTGPGSLTRQSAAGNHQLPTPSSTQVPAQRPTQPSSSSAATPQPNRGENPGPRPQSGHVAREDNRPHTNREAEAPRDTRHPDTAEEPPRNEAAPASNAVPNPDPAPIRLPGPAQDQLFVDDDTLARIRGMAMAKEESPKKVSLPDIIPGFKASSLEIGEHIISNSCRYPVELDQLPRAIGSFATVLP